MAISPMTISPVKTQAAKAMQNTGNQMSRLRQAGVRSIGLDGKYVKIKGVNGNTIICTKGGAIKFLKNLLSK